jgi:DNA-binding MarR family transcriptional regulator
MTDIKPQEYELLNEIAQDSLVTQANLAKRLGIAVGSVNWYIKRLIKRGWVKVSHLDRTRLQYDLTSEGMSVFTERALQYAKDSLGIYKSYRQRAKQVVSGLKTDGVTHVYLEGDDEVMDILRLTCVEAGLLISETPCDVVLKPNGHEYQVEIRG